MKYPLTPGATIIGSNSPNAPVSVATPGEYTFRWVEFDAGCTDTSDVVLTFVDAVIADAGNDTIFCGLNGQLAANGVEGDGDWDILSGVMNFENNNLDNPTVNVNVLTTPQTIVLEWEIDISGCVSRDTITAVFQEAPDADAGPNQSSCSPEYQLGATPSTGSGLWSPPDGIDDPTDPNATLTFIGEGEVTLTWTETIDANCFDSDEVTITFYEEPIADAGEDAFACGFQVQLNAAPPFVGNNALPDVIAEVDPQGVYQYIWTVNNGPCFDQDTVEISFIDSPAPTLGNDTVLCGTTIDLQAQDVTAAGTWLETPGLTFSPVNTPSTTLTADMPGVYEVIWEETASTCSGSDTMMVEFVGQAFAGAGSDITVCAGEHTLVAFPTIGDGTWTCDDPALTIDSPNDFTTDISGPSGEYILVWTVGFPGCLDVDSVTITLESPLSIEAGDNEIACGLSYTFNASPAIGIWSVPTGVIIDDPTDPMATVTVPNTGEFTFTWNNGSVNCPLSDMVTIDFVEAPMADAGEDILICGLTAMTNAVPSVGIGEWSPNVFVNFGSDEDPTTTAFISDVSQFGSYELYWTEQNGGCADTDTVLVTFLDTPFANAGEDNVVCGPNAVLPATLTTGNGEWIETPGGTISDPFDPNASFMSSDFGPQLFVWEESSPTCSTVDSVLITFLQIPNPEAGEDDTFCGLSGVLAADTPLDEGEWSSPAAITFSDPSSPTSTMLAEDYGTFACVWRELNDGQCVRRDTVFMTFLEQPIAVAGIDDEVCGLEFELPAEQSAGIGTWTSPSAVSYSPNDNSPNAIVTVPDFGNYTFTWSEVNGICVDSDELTVSFHNNPDTTNVFILCVNGNTEYQVSFDIVDGEQATYEVSGGAGMLNGSDFLSDPILNGESFEFILSDENDCGDVIISGSEVCESFSEAGVMDPDTIHSCDGLTAAGTFLGGEFLDPNDIQTFILSESDTDPLGSIIQTSTTPDFTQIAGMQVDIVYFIYSIVGNDDGSGQVDFEAIGSDISAPSPVIFHSLPTVESGITELDICIGDTIEVDFSLNGIGPFEVSYTLVDAPFEADVDTGEELTIEVTETGAIDIISISDLYCFAEIDLTVDVISHVIPSFSVDDTLRTCSASPEDIVVELTGEGPWTFDFFIDGSFQNAISTTSSQANVTVFGDGLYSFSNLSGQYCDSEESISIGVDLVSSPPDGLAGVDASYCEGDLIEIGLPPVSGFTYQWMNSDDLDELTDSSPMVSLSNPSDQAVTATYLLTTTNDICTTDDEVTVTIFPLPLDFGLNNPDSICEGESALLEAFGGSEYVWSPDPSLLDFTTASQLIFPAQTTIYTVDIFNAFGCSVTTSDTCRLFISWPIHRRLGSDLT